MGPGKRLPVLLLSLLLLTAVLAPRPAGAAAPVRVLLNGRPLVFDVPPVLEQGRTLVPFRAIGEALGVNVHWDGARRVVHAERGDLVVELTIGARTAKVAGRQVPLDAPAVVRQSRTLVPLRFFSQAFGAAVGWDNATRTVTIHTGPTPAYILGYYFSRSYPDFMASYRELSGVAPKWYTLDENGRLTGQAAQRGISVPDGYQEPLTVAAQAGVETYALIFENTPDKLHQVLSDRTRGDQLIADITALLAREGFTGVNIDFELVREADGPALTAFVERLAQAVHAQGKKLALSLPARTENGWHRAYDYAALGRAADQVAIMAYDKSPGTAGPQTPLPWVREVVDYTLKRIPAEKVLLGLGIYGYDWSPAGRRTILFAHNGLDAYVSYLDDILKRYRPEVKWDESAALPHFTYTDEQGQAHTVWYENTASLRAKLDLVREKGLAGVAFWRLGYTTPEFYQLLRQYWTPVKPRAPQGAR
ncbi:MAG TPA: copper amine oxidase [Firmicutes bacterium]|nr:copper amine oxidase [Bacillota bacterium]